METGDRLQVYQNHNCTTIYSRRKARWTHRAVTPTAGTPSGEQRRRVTPVTC